MKNTMAMIVRMKYCAVVLSLVSTLPLLATVDHIKALPDASLIKQIDSSEQKRLAAFRSPEIQQMRSDLNATIEECLLARTADQRVRLAELVSAIIAKDCVKYKSANCAKQGVAIDQKKLDEEVSRIEQYIRKGSEVQVCDARSNRVPYKVKL